MEEQKRLQVRQLHLQVPAGCEEGTVLSVPVQSSSDGDDGSEPRKVRVRIPEGISPGDTLVLTENVDGWEFAKKGEEEATEALRAEKLDLLKTKQRLEVELCEIQAQVKALESSVPDLLRVASPRRARFQKDRAASLDSPRSTEVVEELSALESPCRARAREELSALESPCRAGDREDRAASRTKSPCRPRSPEVVEDRAASHGSPRRTEELSALVADIEVMIEQHGATLPEEQDRAASQSSPRSTGVVEELSALEADITTLSEEQEIMERNAELARGARWGEALVAERDAEIAQLRDKLTQSQGKVKRQRAQERLQTEQQQQHHQENLQTDQQQQHHQDEQHHLGPHEQCHQQDPKEQQHRRWIEVDAAVSNELPCNPSLPLGYATDVQIVTVEDNPGFVAPPPKSAAMTMPVGRAWSLANCHPQNVDILLASRGASPMRRGTTSNPVQRQIDGRQNVDLLLASRGASPMRGTISNPVQRHIVPGHPRQGHLMRSISPARGRSVGARSPSPIGCRVPTWVCQPQRGLSPARALSPARVQVSSGPALGQVHHGYHTVSYTGGGASTPRIAPAPPGRPVYGALGQAPSAAFPACILRSTVPWAQLQAPSAV